MKYFFPLLLLFIVCTCVRAQVEIQYKPGRTDSARWVYEVTFNNGFSQTYYQPYDTLPEVIDYGRILFYQSGFIGYGRIADNNEYYTQNLLNYIRTQDMPIASERLEIANEIASIAPLSNPMIRDTSLAAEMKGLWTINSAACGMPNDTMEFYTIPGVELLNVAPAGGSGSTVTFLGDGVLNIYSADFVTNVTIVREIEGQQWRSANGCVWQKIVE